jgi:hypothetical protein
MPTIRRADGTQFVIHSYRELLAPQKLSILKNEIRLLAQNHGEYIRLFQQNHKSIEAIFSRDPGYLLGETVWQYFGKPSDLIFCEALPEGQQAIVVVVKANTVYLDTKIPFYNLADEFASLVTGSNQYDVYISGDVPVSDLASPDKFVFDSAFVKSFNRLENPIFQNLLVDSSLELQPLETELRELNSRRTSPKTVMVCTIIILALLLFWYVQTPKTIKPVPTKSTEAVTQGYPDATFYTAMTSPAPQQQLAEAARIANVLYSLPAWSATSINFNGDSYSVNVKTQGGNLAELNAWANANSIHMSLLSNGPQLTINSFVKNRAKPNTIAELQPSLITLIDRVQALLPASNSIQLGAITTVGSIKSTDITIQFTQISPDILSLLGMQFTDLPTKLTSITLSVTDGGLLSGSLKLNVLGK